MHPFPGSRRLPASTHRSTHYVGASDWAEPLLLTEGSSSVGDLC